MNKSEVEYIIKDKTITNAERLKKLLALVLNSDTTGGGGEGGESVDISNPNLLDDDIPEEVPDEMPSGGTPGELPEKTDDFTIGFVYGYQFAQDTFEHGGFEPPIAYEVELPSVPKMKILK